jgi:uncharacterized iron-regulated protein
MALTALVAACGPAPATAPPVPGAFSRAGEDAPVPFDRVVDDLLRARAIYVGERHDHRPHHVLQYRIVEALHARDPSLAVGMEMFQVPFQDALDAWGRGEIDEETLLERTEYAKRWGYDFDLYRPILELARARGIPVVALNAPSELSREVAAQGLDGLAEDVRAELPEMDLGDHAHRALVMDALAAHGDMDEAMLERFYQAQVLWDETMARGAARTLAGPEAPARIVVLAGAMHVRGGHGIPRRAARRGASPYRVVLPTDAVEAPEGPPTNASPAHWWWHPP